MNRKVDDHARQALLCLPQYAAGERLGPVFDFIETADGLKAPAVS